MNLGTAQALAFCRVPRKASPATPISPHARNTAVHKSGSKTPTLMPWTNRFAPPRPAGDGVGKTAALLPVHQQPSLRRGKSSGRRQGRQPIPLGWALDREGNRPPTPRRARGPDAAGGRARGATRCYGRPNRALGDAAGRKFAPATLPRPRSCHRAGHAGQEVSEVLMQKLEKSP